MKKNIQLVILFLSFFVNASNLMAQWTKVDYQNTWAVPQKMVADSDYIYLGGKYVGIIRSSDYGVSWNETGFGYGITLRTFLLTEKGVFVGCLNDDGLFCSTDDGASWNEINTGLEGKNVVAIHKLDSNLFVSNYKSLTQGGYKAVGIYKSTNNGVSWFAVNSGLPTNPFCGTIAFASIDSNLFAGTSAGVFLSTNNGVSWSLANHNHGLPDSTSIISLYASGKNLFAGLPEGVYRTTDNGINWTFLNNGMTDVTSVRFFASINQNIFVATSNGVYLSTNSGDKWQKINDGLTELYVNDIQVFKQYLFCKTGSYIWKRPLSEIVSVEENTSQIPANYLLNQNYPNPFNPSTNISFSLPNNEFVTLKIYDALGKEVALLVNEELNAGSYNNDWNAGNLSSGVYFYRLQAGKFSETKKLLLLK
ncbi:MAG: T9SS type A sorting domain-containing protein [bacterium]